LHPRYVGAGRWRCAGRAGFTLVEVIVVIVIIAILAAIGVPALTGYIDKAKWAGYEQMIHDQRVAFQTMITMQISEDGGVKTWSGASFFSGSDRYFVNCVEGRDLSSGELAWYHAYQLSEFGRAEYEGLTGDTDSYENISAASTTVDNVLTWFSLSGTLKEFAYITTDYFDEADAQLWLFYIDEAYNPDDPLFARNIGYWFSSIDNAKAVGLTSGFNAFKRTGSSRPFEWTRLD
jgi:prepilin-type N-terminal cleavage/methylation domain-containing protein